MSDNFCEKKKIHLGIMSTYKQRKTEVEKKKKNMKQKAISCWKLGSRLYVSSI